MKKRQTIYYTSFADDVVTSKNQNMQLPKDYEWVRKGLVEKIKYKVWYSVIFIVATFYTKCILHIKVRNRKVLKESKNTGYFVYANHTQPTGDAFAPAWICRGKRINTIVSPANLGIPVLGRILPYVGALPIPGDIKGMKLFTEAIETRVKQKQAIIIYPEAHVWPYYTKIRPFPATSFRYPVEQNAPVFCMTTTYQKRHISQKPKITIYIDGPFVSNASQSRKEQRELLCEEIYTCMCRRSENSNYSYYEYVKGE